MDDYIGEGAGRRTFGKIDVAICLILIAVVGVFAIPRYDRFVKTAEAKSTIQQLNEATRAVIEECTAEAWATGDPAALPTEDELIRALTERLGGSIPQNPFTRNSTITVQYHRAIGPCDTLEAHGGWVWSLVRSQGDGVPVSSKVWLNSDTVNISSGKGESCIQP